MKYLKMKYSDFENRLNDRMAAHDRAQLDLNRAVKHSFRAEADKRDTEIRETSGEMVYVVRKEVASR
jgi:hypothetical protein